MPPFDQKVVAPAENHEYHHHDQQCDLQKGYHVPNQQQQQDKKLVVSSSHHHRHPDPQNHHHHQEEEEDTSSSFHVLMGGGSRTTTSISSGPLSSISHTVSTMTGALEYKRDYIARQKAKRQQELDAYIMRLFSTESTEVMQSLEEELREEQEPIWKTDSEEDLFEEAIFCNSFPSTTAHNTTTILYVPSSTTEECESGVQVMIDTMNRYPTNQSILSHGCLALANLATNNNNIRVAIARRGGITLVVRAMSLFMYNKEIQANGCLALANLTLNDNNRVAIAKQDGIDLVINAMKEFPLGGTSPTLWLPSACKFV